MAPGGGMASSLGASGSWTCAIKVASSERLVRSGLVVGSITFRELGALGFCSSIQHGKEERGGHLTKSKKRGLCQGESWVGNLQQHHLVAVGVLAPHDYFTSILLDLARSRMELSHLPGPLTGVV